MRAPVIALGLTAFTLSAVLALAQQDNPFTANEAAIAAGAAIYDTACAGCHGAQGTGGSAPPLNRNLARGADDAALFGIIHDGISGTKMPAFPALSDDNIWRVAAYVRSLNTLAPRPLAVVDAAAGEALFFGEGKCAACHEVNGRGAALAPDLSEAGSKPAIALRNALAHQPLGLRFVTVVNQQGQRSSGFAVAEDLFTLHLRQTDGSLRVLAKSGLRSVTDAENPLEIPLLDDRQTDDIVAFLSTHRKRDLALAAKQPLTPVLPYARIATAEARNWATARGSLDGAHFTALSGITPANVAQLQARWSARLGDGAGQVTPLVVDGILYAASRTGAVQALDAANGLAIWRHTPDGAQSVTGMAMLDGRLFTGGAGLSALNAQTGRTLWRTSNGSAPLALRTRLIAGTEGDAQTAKGAIQAVDPASGEQMWRLETSAEAFGGLTGALGAYEAQNVTLYWSTARTTDDSADSDSILAVNANTGAVTWRHKLARGAGGNGVVIADQTAGTKASLLLHLGRDGLLTVLDRASGKVVRTQSLAKTRVEAPSLSFDRSSFVAAAALGPEVVAVDLRSSRVLWRASLGRQVAGVLATRGGVVFATLADGQVVALAGGKPLWRFRAGGPITSAPVSYAVGTRQFIAVTAGDMVYAFALPS